MVALTDVIGTAVDRFWYDPCGAATSINETVPRRLRYAGYWLDAELGWYLVCIRYFWCVAHINCRYVAL